MIDQVIMLLKTLSSVVEPKSDITPGNLPRANFNTSVDEILNIVFVVITIVSIIFIAIGGLKYVLSSGDSNAIQSAKNTILYAVIGLVVGISAFTIVGFVAGRL